MERYKATRRSAVQSSSKGLVLHLAVVIGFVLVLLGCGNNQLKAADLSGDWTATLLKTSGGTAFSFSTSMREVGSTVLNVSNVVFNPATSCLQSEISASGVVRLASSGYGYYTAFGTSAMSLTVKGSAPGGGTDILNLQGTVNPDNTVSGMWILTGVSANCSGSGAFTMTR
jgi:hypothetical protein